MLYKKIVLAVSVLFLSACASSNVTPVTTAVISMTEFGYAPNSIEVPQGGPVELTVKNDGLVEHDFVIEKIGVEDVSTNGGEGGDHHMSGMDMPEYDLHLSVAAGSTSTLNFTATEPGTYKIFCSVPGHKEAGMIGELIVVSQ